MKHLRCEDWQPAPDERRPAECFPVGDVIREELAYRSSPRYFAEKAGVTLEQAEGIWNGTLPLDWHLAYKLGAFMGMNPIWLLHIDQRYRWWLATAEPLPEENKQA